jgi:aminomethyltransferase
MPVGTPFHARTFALCESLNYRDWSGYYTVSAYETHHEHEYHAIREAAALIDISPLFKYSLTGPDALRLVDRVITRDARRLAEGQVCYTTWCDEAGKVIDDGTVARYADGRFRWTAADPTLRWLRQNAAGLRVTIEDESASIAALALQGPTSAAILRDTFGDDIETLRYFHAATGRIAGVPVDVSRTGYTGDLGYEIWVPADRALVVWDAIVGAGVAYGLTPAGMLALDVARVEAGLLLIDVDFQSVRNAMIPSQTYTPFELGLGRLVSLEKASFIGRDALAEGRRHGPPRMIVGLDVDWEEVEALYEAVGLVPLAPAAASRVAVPVAKDGRQVGRATTTTWSPALKRLLAMATVDAPHFELGTCLEFEITVESVRHYVGATVVPTPFFDPARKTATPTL